MGKDRPQLVILNLANIGRPPTQMRDPRNRIGRRAARNLARGPNAGVKLHRAGHVDQLHDALLDPVIGQEAFARLRKHIDHRIADSNDLKCLHSVFSS